MEHVHGTFKFSSELKMERLLGVISACDVKSMFLTWLLYPCT